ncbi:MAG: ABC transporter ATP-binding protein [Magnetococcales bacterium]|nr:ABC transporter ATP-binding protein [Magnetococcales bacterium]
MLICEQVHAGYGNVRVLHGISFEVQAGKVVALIGANGAGKTTAMRAISGMIAPDQGSIKLDQQPIHHLEAARIAHLGLAHVPEGRHVFAPLTVEDNLLLGAYGWLPRLFGFRRKAAQEMDRVMQLFPKLAERRRQLAGTLSGGEQQMLAIGRAIMARPKVMLLDEPSMGLAPVIVQEVFSIIRRLKDQGMTLLLVEQFASHALAVADYAYVLERGRIVVQGYPEELMKDEQVVTAYLG